MIFTGHGDVEKMMKSYDVGADDYIEKPIDLAVLRSRLHARIQRAHDLSSSGQKFENLKLFPERFEFELNGQLHKLSEIEFDLLKIFLTNPNQKISRDEILKTIWTNIQVTERTVDVHICALRRKLKDFDYNIKSLYGRGYILSRSGKNKIN